MLQSKTRWQLVEAEESQVRELAGKLEIHPLTARLLINRGVSDPEQARRFLQVDLSGIYSPFLMDGIQEAVDRIRAALDQREKILIYGDYDVDGVSSTTLLMKMFQGLEADVDYYIPNRFTEGYGLNENALRRAKEAGVQLMISVDTGISAVKEAKIARQLGLDLIITDHHEPPAVLPEGVAVINPKKPGCSYPCKLLAGVGVAFKLAHALLGRVPEEVLDLAALGTIADLVPLMDENRVIAALGLKEINRRRNIGLSALMDVAGIQGEVTAGHVGFSLGPRINAGGRLDTAGTAVELLLTEDPKQARVLAEELDGMNRERQKLVEEIAGEACAAVESAPEKHRRFIVVAAPGWNVGVIGIVASRLVEKYYRPTIVLGIDEETGMAKGSARSIAGLDLYQALTTCTDLLSQFGGHEMAAGMSLPQENIEEFHRRLDQIAGEWLQEEDYIPLSRVEADLSIAEVNLNLIEELESLEPCGMGNPTPRFRLRGAGLSRLQVMGREKNHLKMVLKDQRDSLEAVGFRLGELAEEIAPLARPELLGELTINEWNHRRSPQFLIRDIRVPHLQVFDWRSNGDLTDRFRRLAEGDAPLFIICQKTLQEEWVTELMIQALTWEELSLGEKQPPTEPRQLVLADLPPAVSVFEELLRSFSGLERLYFAFGDTELVGSLTRTPDREQFKVLYTSLMRRKHFRIPSELNGLSRMTGLSGRWIGFMLKVFGELGFVRVSGDQLEVIPQPAKRPLTQSRLYREQLEREKVQNAFVYSSYRDLCHLVASLLSIDRK